MQLYKKRDFSEFFSDSILFVKENGKHFFKNFIFINGFIILILGALSYVFTSYFLQDFMTGFPLGNSTAKLDSLLDNNLGLFAGLLIAIILCWIIFIFISYSFTPIYFKLYEKHNGTNFTSQDIINAYKANTNKLLAYVVLSFLLGIVLTIIFGIIAFIFIITFVGILALPLIIALFTALFNMTLLEYLDGKRDYFTSFTYTWTLIKSQFWPAVGCMGIFYFINYIIQMSLSIMQSGLNLTSQLTLPNGSNIDADTNIVFIILTLLFFLITFLANILLNALIQINQSVVYFGLKEHNEHINTKSDIDLIGENED